MRRSRLNLFVVAVACGLGSPWAGAQSIELVESWTGPALPTQFSLPSINAWGDLAYARTAEDFSGTEVRFAPRPLSGDPLTLASESLGFMTSPQADDPPRVFLNDESEVVFPVWSSATGAFQQTFMVATPSGSVREATPVTPGIPQNRTMSGRATINNTGLVAFAQQGEEQFHDVGVYVFPPQISPGTPAYTMYDENDTPSYYFISDFPPQLSDFGRVLIMAYEPLAVPRPSLTLLIPNQPSIEIVAGTNFSEDLIPYASMSLSGQIAYAVLNNSTGVSEIRVWNDGVPEVRVTTDPAGVPGTVVDSFMADYEQGGFSINNHGDLAFVATLADGSSSLFLNSTDTPILPIGVPVSGESFNATLTDIAIGPRALNDSGVAAVRARIGFTGTDGVFRVAGPCTADLNGDGILDQGDIQTFVDLFLWGEPAADLNGDGILDQGDIQSFVAAFLAGC